MTAHSGTPDLAGADQSSLADYRALVASAPVGLFRADAAGRYVFVNATWCDTTGMEASSAIGDGWVATIHPDDRAAILAEWQRVVAGGDRFRAEYRLAFPDDDPVWVHAVAEPMAGSGVAAGFVGTLIDVTEQREIEHALLDRDAMLRSFYNGSPLLMGVLELAGDDLLHVSQNAATARLFGTTPDAMDHRLASEMGAPPLLRREWMRRVREAAASRAPVRFEFGHLVSGEPRWFCATVSPIESPHRTRPRFAYVVEDATERRRTEQMLAAQAAELARSNHELERFAYVASHDLQEPLRTMAGYAQLLADGYRGRLGQEADDFIGFIVDASGRMRELVQGLLAYARVSAERPSRDRVELDALVHEIAAHLRAAAEERGATITIDPLPPVVGSREQLRQLFQNLISNAIKFSGTTRPPEIHVTAAPVGDATVFNVADNGIGLDPGDADRLFEIFQRLHGRAEYPGAGIGLAICRRVVEQHGGRIWVESAPGQGATFKFTLPRFEPARRAPARRRERGERT